jgi:hypothetical protein
VSRHVLQSPEIVSDLQGRVFLLGDEQGGLRQVNVFLGLREESNEGEATG